MTILSLISGDSEGEQTKGETGVVVRRKAARTMAKIKSTTPRITARISQFLNCENSGKVSSDIGSMTDP